MSKHYIEKCIHGNVVAQCRCPNFNKRVITVPCPPRCQAKAVTDEQPAPVPNQHPAIWPIVLEDMEQRHLHGIKEYGTPLQPFNGRDPLKDAYQEALDMCVYLRQAIYERDGA